MFLDAGRISLVWPDKSQVSGSRASGLVQTHLTLSWATSQWRLIPPPPSPVAQPGTAYGHTARFVQGRCFIQVCGTVEEAEGGDSRGAQQDGLGNIPESQGGA